jgi:hypothetical protein
MDEFAFHNVIFDQFVLALKQMNSESFDDFKFTHNSKMILGQYFYMFGEVVLQSLMLSTFPFKIMMLTLMCNFRSFIIYKNTRHNFI